MKDWAAIFDGERACVIVPTYNNERTTMVARLPRCKPYPLLSMLRKCPKWLTIPPIGERATR